MFQNEFCKTEFPPQGTLMFHRFYLSEELTHTEINTHTQSIVSSTEWLHIPDII